MSDPKLAPTPDQRRAARGKILFESGQTYRQEDGSYFVGSTSLEGWKHLVKPATVSGGPSCTCEDWVHRCSAESLRCSHLFAAFYAEVAYRKVSRPASTTTRRPPTMTQDREALADRCAQIAKQQQALLDALREDERLQPGPDTLFFWECE